MAMERFKKRGQTQASQLNRSAAEEVEQTKQASESEYEFVYSIDALLEQPERMASIHKRRFRVAHFLGLTLSVAIILYQFYVYQTSWDMDVGSLIMNVLLAATIPYLLVQMIAKFDLDHTIQDAEAITSSTTLERAIPALLPREDALAAIPLIEVIYLNDVSTVLQHPRYRLDQNLLQDVREAFIRLLPRLSAEEGSNLSRKHRDYLHAILQHCIQSIFHPQPDDLPPDFRKGPYSQTNQQEIPYVSMSVAILQAYKQIPDVRALPFVEHVEQLASTQLTIYSSKVLAMVEASRECLPFLLAAADKTAMASTLLRSSGRSSESPDTLLHPVSNPVDTLPAEEVLVRGSKQPSEGQEHRQ